MLFNIFLELIFIPSVLSQPSVSVTTALVTITSGPTPSAVSQAFIGYSYVSALGAYTKWDCQAPDIWSEIGYYARCCDPNPNVECGMATACLSTSLMIGPGGQQTWTCSGTGDQTLCVTGIVYPSIGATQGVTNIECWPSWDGGNWNATRLISGLSITSSSPPTTTMLSSTTMSAAFPSSTSHQATTLLPTANAPASTGRKLNTGGIIGIAIGIPLGVILFAAIAVGLFFCIRSRRKTLLHSSRAVQPDSRCSCGLDAELEASTARERALSNDHGIPVRPVEMEQQNQEARLNQVPVPPGIIGAEGFPAFYRGDGRNPAPTELS